MWTIHGRTRTALTCSGAICDHRGGWSPRRIQNRKRPRVPITPSNFAPAAAAPDGRHARSLIGSMAPPGRRPVRGFTGRACLDPSTARTQRSCQQYRLGRVRDYDGSRALHKLGRPPTPGLVVPATTHRPVAYLTHRATAMVTGLSISCFQQRRVRRGCGSMRRDLVVAEQPLGGGTLVQAVRERMLREPSECWVLVPATKPAHLAERSQAIRRERAGIRTTREPSTSASAATPESRWPSRGATPVGDTRTRLSSTPWRTSIRDEKTPFNGGRT
jgi:hypothetical protein